MSRQFVSEGSRVAVLPLGTVGEMMLRVIAANLQALLGVGVDILPGRPLPEDAFDSARQQYSAARLLQYVDGCCPARYLKVLGVTAVDLFIPILTHVFGEAQLGGRAAVVSEYRLRTGAMGCRVPMDYYYERVAKVAVHEIAHTLSLYHCDRPRCLMQFSAKVEHLDGLHLVFCERCEFVLRDSLRRDR